MLVADFYRIIEFASTDQKIEALIALNKDHDIYRGHFPDQAVTPGVMQIQMIKELIEKGKACNYLMSEISFAKFLNMLIPSSESVKIEIDLMKLNENQLKINAKIFDSCLVFTKLKAVLTAK